MINYRPYQEELIKETIDALTAGKNPVVCAPTGSGKSIMQASMMREICKKKPMSGLALTHIKEILLQNQKAFSAVANGTFKTSIYSAGAGEKHLGGNVVFAGVQSLARVTDLLPHFDPDIVSIDECHRLPTSETTQYGQILSVLNTVPRCGWSATPYRLDSGYLHTGENAWFDELIDIVSVSRLQKEGYLAPLVGVVSRSEMDTKDVHVRRGDFVTSELEEVATDPACLNRICKAIMEHAKDRQKILIFCVSIAHAEAIAETLCDLGVMAARSISGKLGQDERDLVVDQFRSGRIRALTNCEIMSTGVDIAAIDCVVSIRPTMSKSLWVQQIGRGLRIAEGKQDCLLLDFSGNTRRHGDIDGLPEDDITDEPQMDIEKNPAKKKSGQRDPKKYQFKLEYGDVYETESHEVKVLFIRFVVEKNKKNPYLQQIKVLYRTELGWVAIWLLPEHEHKARWRTVRWFSRRNIHFVPKDAETAAKLARTAEVPKSISIRKQGRFWDLKCEHFE